MPSVIVLNSIQHAFLQGVDNWNFDTFGLNRASKGTPLRYVGYELLTRHGCLHKYKVSIGHPHLDGYWSLTRIPYGASINLVDS